MSSIELPGGSMRNYKDNKQFCGVKIAVRSGVVRLGTISFLAATDTPEDQLPTLFCQYETAVNNNVRTTIEQGVRAVLQSGQLEEITVRRLGCERADAGVLFTGILFAEVYKAPKITALACRFFQLLREQLEPS